VIRKGKASKPSEFGKMIKIQETENQIVTDLEVFEKRLRDSNLLVPAVEKHQEQLGRVPHIVAGDRFLFCRKRARTGNGGGEAGEANLRSWQARTVVKHRGARPGHHATGRVPDLARPFNIHFCAAKELDLGCAGNLSESGSLNRRCRVQVGVCQNAKLLPQKPTGAARRGGPSHQSVGWSVANPILDLAAV
jgi:hypothetical protein